MNLNTVLVIIEGSALVITIVTNVVRSAYKNGEHEKIHEGLERRMTEVERKGAETASTVAANNQVTVELKTDIRWIREALKDIKEALSLKEKA